MFGIFKKKPIDTIVYSPVCGTCISLKEVKDEVFSSGVMGNGVAFIPESNEICAPCNGKITMIAETKHAIGIKSENGAEILIHVGMDTVMLNGEGIDVLKAVNTQVKKGDVILNINNKMLQEKGIDLTTPMIINNGITIKLFDEKVGKKVDTMQGVLEVVK